MAGQPNGHTERILLCLVNWFRPIENWIFLNFGVNFKANIDIIFLNNYFCPEFQSRISTFINTIFNLTINIKVNLVRTRKYPPHLIIYIMY